MAVVAKRLITGYSRRTYSPCGYFIRRTLGHWNQWTKKNHIWRARNPLYLSCLSGTWTKCAENRTPRQELSLARCCAFV